MHGGGEAHGGLPSRVAPPDWFGAAPPLQPHRAVAMAERAGPREERAARSVEESATGHSSKKRGCSSHKGDCAGHAQLQSNRSDGADFLLAVASSARASPRRRVLRGGALWSSRCPLSGRGAVSGGEACLRCVDGGRLPPLKLELKKSVWRAGGVAWRGRPWVSAASDHPSSRSSMRSPSSAGCPST